MGGDGNNNSLQTENQLLKKALEREKIAREKAESILDERASTLFEINQRLLSQYENAAKKSAEIEFLHAVTTLANNDDLNIEAALKSFLELVCQLCQWPLGHYYKSIAKEGNEAKLISAKLWYCNNQDKFSEFIKVSENYIFKTKEGLPGRVLHSKNSHWIKDLSQDTNFPRQKLLSELQLKSAFGVPIKIGDTILAVVEFFAETISEKDESRISIIETGAAQLSSLIERHQIQTKLKQNFEALKQAQIQLVQSEKMASLGTIAAGVAHEINNPISFVLSNTETLAQYSASMKKLLAVYGELEQSLSQQKQSIPLAELLSKINETKEKEDISYISNDCDPLIKETLSGIHRIKEIVQGLKTFSRVDEAETKEADVNECIEATLKVIWNELKYKCSLEKHLGQIPKIICYPGQLVQVFTNLFLNSAQAIETRGTVLVTTTSDEKEITVSISDTGKGIAPEHLKNIFTPFFTTKPVGKGTGLGLSISYGIIQKHGGSIDVESTLGHGTKFTIKLPIKNNSQEKKGDKN